MDKIIRIKEGQLKAIMGPSFDYLEEADFSTPFDDDSFDDSMNNPANISNNPQVGVTPTLANDTRETDFGRPITGDEFGNTQAIQYPIRSVFGRTNMTKL